MTEKKILKNRIIFLLSIVTVVFVIILVQALLYPTTARYIKQEKDKIFAYYTSLYLDSDGKGRTVSLEANKKTVDNNEVDVLDGYLNFNLMNYIDEDVTRRDIEYKIDTLSSTTYYDKEGNQLTGDNLKNATALYVKNVWGETVEVGSDSNKYSVSILSNTGDYVSGTGSDTVYKFVYEQTTDGNDIGKTHNISLHLERTTGITNIEDVSIIIRLIKPYTEVYVINIKVSDKLITFSQTDYEKFETGFERLYVQSANSYSYIRGTENQKEYEDEETNDKYVISSKAIKVTFTWSDNLILNENELEYLHKGTGNNPDLVPGSSDGVNNSNNIDIKLPYIEKIDSNERILIVYVPQGSNFYLEFLKTNTSTIEIACKIEVLSKKIAPTETTYVYDVYDELYHGYTHDYVKDDVSYYKVYTE